MKRQIARQHSAGRGDSDVAGSRANWNGCADVCVRDNREIRRNSVERNGGRSGETLAKNRPGLPDSAGIANEGDERT